MRQRLRGQRYIIWGNLHNIYGLVCCDILTMYHLNELCHYVELSAD